MTIKTLLVQAQIHAWTNKYKYCPVACSLKACGGSCPSKEQ